MYREGEIVELKCKKCGEIKKARYVKPENFGKCLEKANGYIGTPKCGKCGSDLEWPENE
jgi:hypothetical protein